MQHYLSLKLCKRSIKIGKDLTRAVVIYTALFLQPTVYKQLHTSSCWSFSWHVEKQFRPTITSLWSMIFILEDCSQL